MSPKTPVKQEDSELFRRTVGKVMPLRHNTLEPVQKRRRKVRQDPATAGYRHIETREYGTDMKAAPVTAGDVIMFRRPGVQDKLFRRLRRGQVPVDAELDLHGMTLQRARTAFERFLGRQSAPARQCCVRIIHGKGIGSKSGLPVIKQQLQAWLQQRPDVLAYCSCRPADGGTGAVYVLLKSTRN